MDEPVFRAEGKVQEADSEMTGIDEFHREITSKNCSINSLGSNMTFYDAKCVQVIDPFGKPHRLQRRLEAWESDVTHW